ncbi:MAG: hypothetical protein JO166_10225 [Deltaproteobacteria bacterium]|nr:hypothetical protein [Deltaproteobacteria bacterium]
MAKDGTGLTFRAEDLQSCIAIIQQFLVEHPSVNIIEVALLTNDQRPLGARVWQVADRKIEAAAEVIAGFMMTHPLGLVTISALNH